MPKFSLCTVTFNRADLMSAFINKTAPLVESLDGEWIIVDNNSTDNMKQLLNVTKKTYPDLKLTVVSSPYNRGMGGGYNQAAKLAITEKLLFVCYDIQVLGDYITPMLESLEKHPETLVGPRVINFPTGWNSFENNEVIPYVEGWAVGCNKSVFERLGGWDENIFLDYEDLELSYRAILGGVGLVSVTLPLLHLVGQTFETQSIERIEYTKRSLKYFCKKWNLTPKTEQLLKLYND